MKKSSKLVLLTKHTLSLEAAKHIATAAEKFARKKGWNNAFSIG